MRTARIIGDGASYYHCMSRIIERRMLLDNAEKERFRKILRAIAKFAGVEVLTYAIMSNHIHLLLYVPEQELTEEEIFKRIEGLYGRGRASDVKAQLKSLRNDGFEKEAETLLYSYTHRMGDLSEYMKMVMQRFTQSYNRRHDRRGTLWEDRFKSILVEGSKRALTTMAAYIDLNAVRAGMVEDPKEYRFCGYGEAVAGGKEARRGLEHICYILGREGDWSRVGRAYREYLFTRADSRRHGSAIDKKKIAEVLGKGGKLSQAELLHCRLRYLSDGVVLGGKAFVEGVFQSHREEFGLRRSNGARRPKYGDWGNLYTMRDLRLQPVSLPATQ